MNTNERDYKAEAKEILMQAGETKQRLQTIRDIQAGMRGLVDDYRLLMAGASATQDACEILVKTVDLIMQLPDPEEALVMYVRYIDRHPYEYIGDDARLSYRRNRYWQDKLRTGLNHFADLYRQANEPCIKTA